MVFTNNARLCKKIIAVTAKISASSQDRSKSFIFPSKKSRLLSRLKELFKMMILSDLPMANPFLRAFIVLSAV